MKNEPYVPGPYDEFRGIIEIDCYECLSPEWKAKFRIGKFVEPGEVPPNPEPPKTKDSGETA